MHGWGGNKDSFGSLPKKFYGQYAVTTVDFYGFGDTPAPKTPLTLKDFADAILEIVRHYKMQHVTLVGHSFGGRVAMLFAALYGYYVEKLVLIDASGIRPRRSLAYYFRVYGHKLLKKIGKNGFKGSDDYEKLDKVGKQTFVNVINFRIETYLPRLTMPTLLIWGCKDKATPLYMAKKIQKALPDVGLVTFSDAGHFSYLDKPSETYSVLKYFLCQ